MRMWIGVLPEELCMQHLSGEHNEIHKHKHNFEKKHSIAGRVEGNAVEPLSMKTRHDELAAELQKRAVEAGRKPPHSPYELPDLSYLPEEHLNYRINQEENRALLRDRCPDCRDRMNGVVSKEVTDE